MTDKTLKKLVIGEATKLKASITSSELLRLNIESLDPTSYKTCIYGQMTGDCFNERATELIESCCEKLITGEIGGEVTPVKEAKISDEFARNTDDGDVKWSPIELFIAQVKNTNNGNNARLVAFLKGETETLEFV